MNSIYRNFGKRLLDIGISLPVLIITIPFLLVIATLIFLSMGKPVLFVQERTGLKEKRFNLLKFRTMKETRDAAGSLLEDKDRLTKFGQFLRSSSMDELPSLLNVLKGNMSLVGPRPLLTEYEPLYNDFQKQRHNVKPGITGWAQINGRNNLSWKEKFELDVWYIQNMSFFLDVKILILTFLKVLKSKDINQDGQATAAKFNGKN